jgi:hypothetical protein
MDLEKALRREKKKNKQPKRSPKDFDRERGSSMQRDLEIKKARRKKQDEEFIYVIPE